jgi:hypothetical protein
MTKFNVGDEIKFEEDILPYTVRAATDRYLVCTRKLNRRKDADLLWFEVQRGDANSFTEAYNYSKSDPVYTIVDLKENIRGTENLVFGRGFHTEVMCSEAIGRLESGESEISHKTRIALKILKSQP